MDSSEIQVGKFYWVQIGPQSIRVKVLAVPMNEGSHYAYEDAAGATYMTRDPDFIESADGF